MPTIPFSHITWWKILWFLWPITLFSFVQITSDLLQRHVMFLINYSKLWGKLILICIIIFLMMSYENYLYMERYLISVQQFLESGCSWNCRLFLNYVQCTFLDGKCYTTVDLVLALDASYSVGPINWKKEVQFAKEFISNFHISKTGTHIGVIDFGTVANVRVDLNSIEGTQAGEISERLDKLKGHYPGGSTYTDLALTEGVKMFQNISASRNVSKLFIIVTDGQTTWRNGKTLMQVLDQPLRDLQSLSVTTYTVGIGKGVNDKELKLLAGNIDPHVLKIDSFEGLLGNIKELKAVACR